MSMACSSSSVSDPMLVGWDCWGIWWVEGGGVVVLVLCGFGLCLHVCWPFPLPSPFPLPLPLPPLSFLPSFLLLLVLPLPFVFVGLMSGCVSGLSFSVCVSLWAGGEVSTDVW